MAAIVVHPSPTAIPINGTALDGPPPSPLRSTVCVFVMLLSAAKLIPAALDDSGRESSGFAGGCGMRIWFSGELFSRVLDCGDGGGGSSEFESSRRLERYEESSVWEQE